MNHRLSSRIERVEREQQRQFVTALRAMTELELAALSAEGTCYTAEQVLAFTDAERWAFLAEQGLGWILDLRDDELEQFLVTP